MGCHETFILALLEETKVLEYILADARVGVMSTESAGFASPAVIKGRPNKEMGLEDDKFSLEETIVQARKSCSPVETGALPYDMHR